MRPDYLRHKFYIGGQWSEPAGEERISIAIPSTDRFLGEVPDGGPSDIDAAVSAALGARDSWASSAPGDRAKWLFAIADELERRSAELTQVIVDEVGMPRKLASPVQVGLPIRVTRRFAELVSSDEFSESLAVRIGNSLVRKVPAGVVGAITPWNVPLHQTMAKVAAALAAGCTVVLKPSELTPFNAYVLAEVIDAVGLPPGVFNMVVGAGPAAGAALAGHPDVDVVSFTGSEIAGAAVMRAAADNVAKVTLELGGKSASVILPSADLPRAVRATVNHAMLNSGQACNAWTRMLVKRADQEIALEVAAEALKALPLGDPNDPSTRLGPVRTGAARERIWSVITQAQKEGARLAVGGTGAPEGVPGGHFVTPTVLADVERGMTVAQEEVFGPVLSVIPYDTVDDAIAIANDSRFGLGGGVWAGSTDEAVSVAGLIRTGQVDINGGSFNPLAPFGGFKHSGTGRELGLAGLSEYLDVQSLQL